MDGQGTGFDFFTEQRFHTKQVKDPFSKAALAPETYTIDVSNESMIGGPQANPQLAAKMAQVYNDVGLVLLRGQAEVGNDLAVGKKWVTVCMPHLAKYEGGANPRKGKGVDNVYEVGAPGVSD